PRGSGLFISPHLLDVRERISLQGDPAADELWREAHGRVRAAVPEPELSYFEWLLVLAAEMFRLRSVPVAVFEIGLGGRFDAANALDPCLSVLTNVSLDHTAILGETVTVI